MEKLKKPVAALASLALIVVLFVSAFELACYGDFDYYRKEYEKYEVLDTVDMEMDDLMHVTREMMAYLRGDRERLSVETTVAGQTRDFFNEQDRIHMADVRGLFLTGLQLRLIFAAIAVVSVLLLAALKAPLRKLLPRAFLWTTAAMVLVVLALGIFAALDFDRCFYYFHLIFFDNDLWMFDPSADLMINVLVEEFFMDIALRIALVFVGMMAIVSVACGTVLWTGRGGKRRHGQGTRITALLAVAALGIGAMAAPMTARAELDSPVEGENLVTEHVSHDFTFPSDWPEAPELGAGAAVLMEISTGTVLYAKNADVELYPASMTKVMTGLLVAEYGRMSDIVTYTRDAVINNLDYGAMTMGISVGEEISVKDSFYGMMLQSANDAANGLAEYISGSNEAFADLMNARAREIGAYNTHFSNPSGLFGSSHYTTCYDMALIMAEAVKNYTFLTVATTMSYRIEPTNKYDQVRALYQQHRMKEGSSYEYEGFVCGKLGWIDESGNTLVTYCERDGMQLVAVVMKDTNPGHYEDTTALMDYGFDNFQLCQIDGSLLTAVDGDYLSSSRGLFDQSGFSIEENHDSCIILPKDASLEDVKCELDYDLEEEEQDENIIANIIYSYHDMVIGSGTLEFVRQAESLSAPRDGNAADVSGEETPSTGGETESPDKEGTVNEVVVTVAQVVLFIVIILAVVLVIIVLAVYFNPQRVRERRVKRRRRARMKNRRFPDDIL